MGVVTGVVSNIGCVCAFCRIDEEFSSNKAWFKSPGVSTWFYWKVSWDNWNHVQCICNQTCLHLCTFAYLSPPFSSPSSILFYPAYTPLSLSPSLPPSLHSSLSSSFSPSGVRVAYEANLPPARNQMLVLQAQQKSMHRTRSSGALADTLASACDSEECFVQRIPCLCGGESLKTPGFLRFLNMNLSRGCS